MLYVTLCTTPWPGPFTRTVSRHHLTPFLPALPSLLLQLQRDLTFLCTHPGTSDPVTLASHLTSAGYSASVRRAVGGGGSSCFRNLRHEFLVVKGDGKDSRDDYVVDLRFREQFQISHPTPDYAALLALLPEAYAGPVSAVMPIVQVSRVSMCSVVAPGGDGAGEKAREGSDVAGKTRCHEEGMISSVRQSFVAVLAVWQLAVVLLGHAYHSLHRFSNEW